MKGPVNCQDLLPLIFIESNDFQPVTKKTLIFILTDDLSICIGKKSKKTTLPVRLTTFAISVIICF